jgi:hypothetical protein
MRHLLASFAVSALVAATSGCGDGRNTSLRPVGAIDELPLAPSAANTDALHFEYNEWDVAYKVTGCDECPRAPYAAAVRVIEKGPSSSHIKVKDGSYDQIGWVPNDWLASSAAPLARRESEAAKQIRMDADTFVGVDPAELQRRLGTPLKVRKNYSDIDGEFETWVFDETRGRETFFIILKRDGIVCMGEYQGRRLTPKYK